MGKIILSTVLSFLFPGLGQLFNNKRLKAALFIVLGIVLVYVNIFGFTLPLTLFRFVSAGEALYSANKLVKTGKDENFLKPKKAILAIGTVAILIFFLTFVPYRFVIKPATTDFSQVTPQKGSEEMKIAEEKMIQFLEKKYQKKFTIEHSHFIVELGKYVFDVTSPEGFIFNGTYYPNSEKFVDGYINGIWANEFDDSAEPVIQEQFRQIWEYNRGVWADEKIVAQVNPLDIPSYKTFREQHPEAYEQKFELVVLENVNEKNKKEVLEKLFRIVKVIKEEGVKKIQFHVYFYDEKLFEKEGENISFGPDYNDYALYDIHLIGKYLENIDSPDDLEKYLKKEKK